MFCEFHLQDGNFFPHSSHNSNRLQRQKSGIANFVVDNRVENFFFVVTREWRFANEHLEDENSQAPPVDCSRVGCLGQHFGSEKLWRSTERSGSVAKAHSFFAQSEVGDFYVT